MFIVQKCIDRGHSDHYYYGSEKHLSKDCSYDSRGDKMSLHIKTLPEYSKFSSIVNHRYYHTRYFKIKFQNQIPN